MASSVVGSTPGGYLPWDDQQVDTPTITTLSHCQRRTLRVETPGGGSASAFVLTRGDDEWLVTAGHVADRWSDGTIQVRDQDGEVLMGVGKRLPKVLKSHKDVAVFRFSGHHPDFGPPLRARTNVPPFAQNAYFLGFPILGLGRRLTYAQKDVPFIKSAILAGRAKDEEGTEVWLLDGTNIPGFSGGPIVTCEKESEGFRALAVVSAYVPLSEDCDPEGRPPGAPFDDCEPRPLGKPTAGLAVGFDIQHALAAIDEKLGGSPLE